MSYVHMKALESAPGRYDQPKLWARIGYRMEMPFTLQVASERCRGCKTCAQVCPKGVFELYRLNGELKSRVAHMANCEQCTACVKQCPEHASVAEPPIRGFEGWEDQPA